MQLAHGDERARRSYSVGNGSHHRVKKSLELVQQFAIGNP